MKQKFRFKNNNLDDCYKEITSFVNTYGKPIFSLVFGSVARGTNTKNSDLDLVYIVESTESLSFYKKIKNNNTYVDLNMYTIDVFQNKLKELEWQYRLFEFKIIECANSNLFKSFELIKLLINSETARNYRIKKLIYSVEKSINNIENINSSLESKNLALIQAICHCTFLNYEINGIIPFQSNKLNLTTFYSWFGTNVLDEVLVLSSNKLGELRNKLRKKVSNPEVIEVDYPYNLNSNTKGQVNLIKLKKLKEEFKVIVKKFESQRLYLEVDNISLRKVFKSNINNSVNKQEKENEFRYHYYNQKTNRLKLIVPTGGCQVPLCTFCDLPRLAYKKKKWELSSIAKEYDRINELVLYTDGSFFDPREVEIEKITSVINFVSKHKIRKLSVESLPRFLDQKVLESIVEKLRPTSKLQINIGVQSVNQHLRDKLLSSPIRNEEFNKIKVLKQLDINFRIYLIFGKPLLTIEEDILDIRKSIEYFSEILDENDIITVNPLHISNGTIVNDLFKKGIYKSFPISNLIKTLSSLNNKYPFIIEMGEILNPTCSDVDISSDLILKSNNFLQPFGMFSNLSCRIHLLKEIYHAI